MPGDPDTPTGGLITVEPMERRHLRQVRRIDRAAYPEPWSRQLWLTELDRASGRWYRVASRDRAVVGFVGALQAADDGHILIVGVDPAHRRQGIASRLMVGVVRELVAAGCTALTLEVRVSNRDAVALYRRFGLAPAGVRRGYYRPGNEDALIMWAHDIDAPRYAARLAGIEGELGASPCR